MKLPLFGIGLQTAKTLVVTAKLLLNFYIEFRPDGELTRVVALGFPGLDLYADFGDTPVRGMIPVESDYLETRDRGQYREPVPASDKATAFWQKAR